MNDILVDSYYIQNKKKYRYRFEIASENGERKWKSKRGFDTKTAALKAGKEAQAIYERGGVPIEPSSMSYTDFTKLWLEAAPVKETTKKNYEKKLRLYILPKIGKLRLKSVQRADLRNILIDLTNEGFARNTISVIKGIIVKSFEFAVEERYIIDSPAANLKMPRIERPDKKPRSSPRTIIPQEQMDKIMKRFPVGHPSHIPLLLGYSCGLRLSETFALTWDNIDLEAKTLTVNKQIQWHQDEARTQEDKKIQNGRAICGDGYWYFSNPKYGSVRTITMSDNLVNELCREKERQEMSRAYYKDFYNHYYVNEKKVVNQNQDGEEIFFIMVREAGDYISSRTMQYTSKVIHEQLGFQNFDYHSLRHTHASMLAEMGAPASYVSHRLGHKNVSTTLDVYYHMTEGMEESGDKYLNQKF